MVEISFIDKIKTIFSLIFSSPLFFALLLGIVLMMLDVLIISKKSKTTRVIYFLISILLTVSFLINYNGAFLNVINTISKNIVTIIYFPSVLEYIIILLINLIILVVTLFKKRMNKTIKYLNIFVFIINLFLFFLILDQISINNIDISSKIGIYSNQNLMVLFESSMILFIIWIVILILYLIIKKLIGKEETRVNNFYEEPEMPKSIEELRKQILSPEPKIEYVIVEKERFEDLFTLEDYKKMKKLLEQIKEEENISNK